MNRISPIAHAPAGVSGALFDGEGRTALDSAQPELTISQMSRVFGVSLRTLRFYEDRGLLKPRREGNARFYRSTDRIRMEMILKGKKLGFTLTEIQDLIGGKGASEMTDLEDQLNPQQIVTRSVTWSGNATRSRERSTDCGRRKAASPRAPPPDRRRSFGRSPPAPDPVKPWSAPPR